MTTKETMKEMMQEKIFAAADALDEQGQKPTPRLIRKETGGGSYSTIHNAPKFSRRNAGGKLPAWAQK